MTRRFRWVNAAIQPTCRSTCWAAAKSGTAGHYGEDVRAPGGPGIADRPGAPALKVSGGDCVRPRRLPYEPARLILHDVSFRAPGDTVVIVGRAAPASRRSACSASTMSPGSVRIDGQTSVISQASLRAAIGVVPQDTAVQRHDLLQHRLWRPGASREEVEQAAHPHFIVAPCKGYEAPVDERA